MTAGESTDVSGGSISMIRDTAQAQQAEPSRFSAPMQDLRERVEVSRSRQEFPQEEAAVL